MTEGGSQRGRRRCGVGGFHSEACRRGLTKLVKLCGEPGKPYLKLDLGVSQCVQAGINMIQSSI
ncbi:hypothetical protein Taro_042120 [Colocasia esculenta]|uniref:Uncharacterized protein n=1 Tax=Colocasia esculenta TaxID=4460 RepID=A0A843WVK9_COLES|nr:hypothetical protein [Colocasia esculenta]